MLKASEEMAELLATAELLAEEVDAMADDAAADDGTTTGKTRERSGYLILRSMSRSRP